MVAKKVEDDVEEVSAKTEVILPNAEKVARAKVILALILGKKTANTAGEVERKEKWTIILAENKIDPKKEEAMQWVYEKLGGEVRTHEEQAKFEKKVSAMKKKKNYEE